MIEITVKKWIDKILLKFNAGENIFIAIGIIAMVAGILVDVFIIRIICLFVLVGSAIMIYSSLRAKHLQIQTNVREANSLIQSKTESEMMKRLIFDDFRPNINGKLNVEEVNELDGKLVSSQLSTISSSPEGERRSVQPYKPVVPMEQPVVREFQLSDFFDVDSAIFKEETEPRTEFDFLLNKVLAVIKEVLFAHTVALFWANREKQQMIMESHISDCPGFFSARRFSIGHDLVSKVATSGKPEFITEVNPLSESELFRYYDAPSSVKSFVGVPIFFTKGSIESAIEQPVAVLAVDSKTEDEFGTETLTLLGQFTKLISALIKSYNEKYDLLLDSELLRAIRRLQERIRSNFSLSTIVQALAEETSKLINWDFLSIVLYDEAKRAWVAKKVTNRSHEGYIVTEQAIDFPESVVGKTIKSNSHSLIDDLNPLTVPRYFSEEKLEKKGSFVSVPISSLNKCYGAISLESRETFNFSRHDLEMIYRMAENVAAALEIFYMQEIINEYVIVDNVTGMYSKKFFVQRMEEELQRADDAGNELSLLFITIDKADEITQRFGNDGYERVILTLAKAIRSSVRHYDLVGRYESDRFGVLLVNTAANEAYLWAEKIRKNIAGLVINLDGKNFSITISIGVAGALEGMKKEELLGNTVAVLNAASQVGGNVVRVF